VRKPSCAIVVALALGASACGADPNDAFSSTTVATTAAPQPTSAVTYPANGVEKPVVAIDNNFLPQNITVAAGTKVTFTNRGRNPHNIIPVDDAAHVNDSAHVNDAAKVWGALDTQFQPKAVYSYVFVRTGTFTYYCTIHGSPTGGMFGTITVTAP
jgi:plastocyanin